MEPPVVQGRQPSDTQIAAANASIEHWRKTADEAPVQAITRAEEAAKQLVALTGTLQGLYFAVYAFSDLQKRVDSPWLQLVFFAPLALWLISLYCATRVFVPQPRGFDLNNARPNALEDLPKAYNDAGIEKLVWLRRSHRLLVASFAVVLGLLVALAFIDPPSDSGPTKIMIVTPTVPPSATPTP
jgi:hypothetical protein